MNYEKEFINQLKVIRDYWLNLPDKTTKEVADGILFSLLVMFDGDSGVNDFHYVKLTDMQTHKIINKDGYLHEQFHSIMDESV